MTFSAVSTPFGEEGSCHDTDRDSDDFATTFGALTPLGAIINTIFLYIIKERRKGGNKVIVVNKIQYDAQCCTMIGRSGGETNISMLKCKNPDPFLLTLLQSEKIYH